MNQEQQRVDELRTRLTNAFAPDSLEIDDQSARHAGHAGARGGGHYRVRIVSTAFHGKTALQRHRMVYGLFKDVLGGALHALSLPTKTPEEV